MFHVELAPFFVDRDAIVLSCSTWNISRDRLSHPINWQYDLARHSPRMAKPRIIQGVYRHGRVEMEEIPTDVDEAPVLIVFLEDDHTSPKGKGNLTSSIDEQAEFQSPPPITSAGPIHPKAVEIASPVIALAAPVGDHSAAGAILDYASPRPPKGRARLPARSRLTLVHHSRGVAAVERLNGEVGSVAALIFGFFILICVGWVAVTQFRSFHLEEGSPVLWALWLVEAILIPLVINDTWRRTTLTATADTLTLRFVSPFTSKEYIWKSEHVEDLRVVQTQQMPPALAELQVHVIGLPLVRLFIDHLEGELMPIRTALCTALGR